MMMQAGLSLDRALEMLHRASSKARPNKTPCAPCSIASAAAALLPMLWRPRTASFPAIYIGMVRAGEAGGSLDTTLRQLAELLERSRAAREHVKSALAYPMVVLATGCASIAILFGFVIPRFGRSSMVPARHYQP